MGRWPRARLTLTNPSLCSHATARRASPPQGASSIATTWIASSGPNMVKNKEGYIWSNPQTTVTQWREERFRIPVPSSTMTKGNMEKGTQWIKGELHQLVKRHLFSAHANTKPEVYDTWTLWSSVARQQPQSSWQTAVHGRHTERPYPRASSTESA